MQDRIIEQSTTDTNTPILVMIPTHQVKEAKSLLNLTYLIPTGAPRTIAPNALRNAPGMDGKRLCSKIKEMKR